MELVLERESLKYVVVLLMLRVVTGDQAG
ncbi:MAG: hypothetical protein JWR26_2125, partial [Pedosphaera sp.]|nr:hypothetical protein [Pedosphaera sp.]